MEEARRQVEESGFAAMTIRTVAKGCGVGVGTVYNYFSGKEEFAALVLLTRWKKTTEHIESMAQECAEPEMLVRCMYRELCAYMDQYSVLFRDEAAIAVFTASFARYHELLRAQLAKPVRPFCQSDFEAEFVAEALLTWTVAGEGFDEIYQVIRKILK